MKKLLVVGVIVLFIGMTISSSTGLYVEKQSSISKLDGNTLYVGGNGTGNYSTIQDAIDNASNGDTVFVYDDSSPYYENIVVNNKIILKGEDKNTTIVVGNPSKNWVIFIRTSYVTVTGFTIKNCSFLNGAGIYILSSFNNIYQNIINNNYNGIKINGFYADICGNEIHHNIISDCEDGYGIDLINTSHSKIFENTISSYEPIILWYVNNVSIYENVIIATAGGASIDVYDTTYSEIYGNNISGKGTGIRLPYGNSNNTIYQNSIVNNNFYGIFIEENNNYNHIFHNNFINNTQNAYDEYNNIWDDGYPSGGNYWDDYTGNDSDGDGIGDVPYNISGGDNRDRYPLMEPYGQTLLDIGIISGGLFKIKAGIKNIGRYNATKVNWTIKVLGRFPPIINEWSGNIKIINPNKSEIITSGFIFGFGKYNITITAEASNAPKVSKSINGYIILFFILIR